MPSLQEIENSWESDCSINPLDLTHESTKTPKLYWKYQKMLIHESYALQLIDDEVKKIEHYLDLLYQSNRLTDSEYDMLGWEPLAKLPATAAERVRSINIDKRMVDIRLKYTAQKLKIDTLKDILAQINTRQWHIRNAIENRKFESGN